ncbi:MAG: type II toxin-antitoxin system VapC family toxin [Gammaproteobacteria bacterium]|nr:type II toxin-antitoxin system VapC family toxin [Gammaproteobacteria bacterium]
MSAESNYIDTSALAKWYLNEARSDEFADWIQGIDLAIISELTKTEMRCLLARRRRMKELDRESEARIFTTFQSDIITGQLLCPPIEEGYFENAIQLIDRLPKIPLRTLDALHLAVAQQQQVKCVATADCVFASAAEGLGFEVIKFVGRESMSSG